MQYNSIVDGQRRQSRRDLAPHPSVYSVRSRLLPEAGCRHFSCTDNPIVCEQPGQHCTREASRTSSANAKRDPSIADESLKTSDRQTDLLGVGLLVLLLGRQRGNLDLDAQSLSSRLHGQGDTTTVEVDLHDLDLNLVAHVGDLRRLVDVLVGHLGDVHQALDALAQVDESAERDKLGHSALDDSADGVLLDQCAPRILGGLLETQGDALAVEIDVENLDLDLLADLDNLGRRARRCG